MTRLARHASFKTRLRAGERLVGTYVKTPSPIVCEVLGASELAAVCLDAEHAPFGRLELDACVQALRAADMPSLVRVAGTGEGQIMQALDCGATGVIVPHVTSGAQAEAIVKASHFGNGGRGYVGSSRAAAYTMKSMRAHIDDSAKQTTIVAQIEDARAVDVIDEICTVSGIDCVFVGRNDLTVSLGAQSPADEIVVSAVEKICRAGADAGRTVGMFVPNLKECRRWQDCGASLFLLCSDHAFLLDGARRLLEHFDS